MTSQEVNRPAREPMGGDFERRLLQLRTVLLGDVRYLSEGLSPLIERGRQLEGQKCVDGVGRVSRYGAWLGCG